MRAVMPASICLVLWAMTQLAAAQTSFDKLLNQLRPEGYVTDHAAALSAAQKQGLERMLEELKAKTTVDIAVVVLPSLEGGEVADFANRLFEKWGVGKTGKDNGLLFLVALQDRKMRIEVGYGLERLLTDARTGRILDESVLPFFRQNRFGDGITQGTVALALVVARDAGVTLSGQPATAPVRNARRNFGIGRFLFLIVLLVIVAKVFRRHPVLAALLLSNMGHRRGYRGGGGGFGGGGFGGGGFGGFGGGSSGGGGASRSW